MTASPRFFGLARLLLASAASFARIAGVLFLPLMSACVLPIGPEFQDPPASQNFAPFISDSSPPLGSIVTEVAGTVPPLRVTVTDPNIADDLFVRWVADYPRRSSNTRLLGDQMVSHSTNGQPLRQDVSKTLDCIYNLAPIAQHQVVVIVADREFLSPPPEDDLASVKAPGFAVLGSWIVNLNCGSASP